jgi:hypothetical protein
MIGFNFSRQILYIFACFNILKIVLSYFIGERNVDLTHQHKRSREKMLFSQTPGKRDYST